MDSNDRFISLYNKLDNVLREYYNINSRSTSCIKRYEDQLKKSPFDRIRERGFALESIRNVRNTLVHDAKVYSKDAFLISEDVNNFLDQEIDYILNPRRAKDIAIPLSRLYYVRCNSKVKEVSAYMASHFISHAPILDEEGRLVGVFSESTIYTYLLEHSYLTISENTLISDFLDYTALEAHSSERFAFIKENTLLSDINDSFIKRVKNEKRLAMIFLTRDGKKDQKILGILTATDFAGI